MVTRRFFGTGLEPRLTIVSSFFHFFFLITGLQRNTNLHFYNVKTHAWTFDIRRYISVSIVI